ARALLAGLLDGTIDCVATDHAPLRWIDKACEFEQAEPGITGLETAFGLLMRLGHAGGVGLARLLAGPGSPPPPPFRPAPRPRRAGRAGRRRRARPRPRLGRRSGALHVAWQELAAGR